VSAFWSAEGFSVHQQRFNVATKTGYRRAQVVGDIRDQVAPLDIIPVKYGIKNLKRVGKIKFTTERPKDYWEEQGYDWYAGL